MSSGVEDSWTATPELHALGALATICEDCAIKSFVIYAVLLPLVVLALLGIFRVRFARRFWRQLYLLGLIYVAVIIGRVVWLAVT